MEKIKLFRDNDDRLNGLLVCMVLATIPCIAPSPEKLTTLIDNMILARKTENFPPQALKDAVRDMLRKGGYKPAGRQKPSSEYLAQAAREERFPFINGPVDCNNLLSFETGLPISLLDMDELGYEAKIRICKAGETYVFNASGQEMDLENLICICTKDGVPLGNPIKDSMRGKLKETTVHLAGSIFAPLAIFDTEALLETGRRFSGLLTEFCQAEEVAVVVDSK
jgi:DNA/RNA-binding domain of Phe-tRNA-synthetase-like protein